MSPIIHALLIVTCTHALVALGTNNGESFSSLGIEPIGSINYTFDYNSTEPTCYHCENPFFTQMNSTSCSNADGLFSELDVKQFNDSIPPDYVLTEYRMTLYGTLSCNYRMRLQVSLNSDAICDFFFPPNEKINCSCPLCTSPPAQCNSRGSLNDTDGLNINYTRGGVNYLTFRSLPTFPDNQTAKICISRVRLFLFYGKPIPNPAPVPEQKLGPMGIIAIIALVLLGGSIIAVGIFWYIRSRRQQGPSSAGHSFEVAQESTPLLLQQNTPAKPLGIIEALTAAKTIKLVDINDLQIIEALGEGANGIVLKARWISRDTDVALKQLLLPSDSVESSEILVREIGIMAELAHPHILQLLGVCITPDQDIRLVMEYMDGGSLADCLPNISSKQIIPIITQIAFAMHYLHSRNPPILHRDLKLENVLINKSHTQAKLCDFGLSKVSSVDSMRKLLVGTAPYLCPESIGTAEYTTKSDVYAFGVLVYEIVNRKRAFQGVPTLTVLNIVKERGFDQPLDNTPPAFADLIRSCTAMNPSDRPSFKVVLDLFKTDSIDFTLPDYK